MTSTTVTERSARPGAPADKIPALPPIVILETLFAKNIDSPVSWHKSVPQKYRELMNMLYDVLYRGLQNGSAKSARDVPFTKLFSISEMIIYALAKVDEILTEVMRPDYAGDFLTCHPLNVAFLSCKVGMQTNLPHKELSRLCVAALLHDVGMTRIAKDAFSHERGLTKQDRDAIENHPMAGYEFFAKLRGEFPWLAQVILEEHKREHDQGYPKDGGTTELHPFSRIVGIADTFEALSHRRTFRKAFHPADVMKGIVESKDLLFLKPTVRALIGSMSLYPVGSTVQLNNKKLAMVVDAGHGSPLRPIVRIVDGDGNAMQPTTEVVDLSKDNMLYVTGLVYTDHYQLPDNLRIV